MEPVRPCELNPGERIRVKTTFTDFDGDEVAAGTVLTFRDRSYFPYDGGHTWMFEERTIRLAEIADQDAIIGNEGGVYFERAE